MTDFNEVDLYNMHNRANAARHVGEEALAQIQKLEARVAKLEKLVQKLQKRNS